MRIIFLLLVLILLAACSAKNTKPVEMERDIYISSIDTSYDANGRFKMADSSKTIRFSKDFWNYFIRTHPKASALLFILPLTDTNKNYIALPDTSYTFYNVTEFSSSDFTKLLADSVTGQEKTTQTGASFIVIPDDTTGLSAKEERTKQKLRDYQINSIVRNEFDSLKRILTWQDTAKHYIIVFKKNFADKIYQLYE